MEPLHLGTGGHFFRQHHDCACEFIRLLQIEALTAVEQVVWRGNNSMRKTHGMDIISRHYLEAEGIPFVDTRAIMEHFKDMLATGCCSDLKVSNGQHIGAIAKFHNESSRLTVSSMVTQGVLGSICVPEPGSAALPAL